MHTIHKKDRHDLPWLVCRTAHMGEENRPAVVLNFVMYANVLALLLRKAWHGKPMLWLSDHLACLQVHPTTSIVMECMPSIAFKVKGSDYGL